MIAASVPTDRMASTATFAIIPRKETEVSDWLDERKKGEKLVVTINKVKELTKNRSLSWYQPSNNEQYQDCYTNKI
jgi:hypothetical protein